MSDAGTLAEWLACIERQHPVAIDLGLERVATVATRLDLATTPIAGRVVTVAGTNGKGSTVAMLEALARAHGLSTATYTSPHLLRYNERLRFDGQEADDELLVAGFEKVEAARLEPESVSLTYFEMGTLAALWAIAERRPDMAILEVGLGGRLDAVNVIDADVAVITTVAQDHADFLGTDIEGIGREKAGVLRAGRPAVLGSETLPDSVLSTALELGAGVHLLGRDFHQQASVQDWQWRGQGGEGDDLDVTALPDPGLPLDNAASALQALALTGVTLDAEACRGALAAVDLPGRMQWLGRWCLDVAHNPQAASYLASRLALRPRPRRRLVLLGMLSDKDAEGIVAALAPQVDAWVAVGLEGPRGRDAAQLAELLDALGQRVLHRADSPRAGADWLAVHLNDDDEALVCGSFLTVGEVLDWHRARDDTSAPSSQGPARRQT